MFPWLSSLFTSLGGLGGVASNVASLLNSKMFLYACIAVTVFWVYASKIDADYAARDAKAIEQALRDKLDRTNEAIKLIAEDAKKVRQDRESLHHSIETVTDEYAKYVSEHSYEKFKEEVRKDPKEAIRRTNTEYLELFDKIGEAFGGTGK